MTDVSGQVEFLYSPSETADLLKIKSSTLRKYAILLQNAGYQFQLNEKGQRSYLDKDVIAIRRFLEYKDLHDMTLEKAAKSVVEWVRETGVSLTVTDKSETDKRYNDAIQSLQADSSLQTELLKEMLQQMNQMDQRQQQMAKQIEEQHQHIERQQKYIEERLVERDEKVMEALNKSHEEKKLLLEDKEANKKGFFSKMFKK